MTNETSVRAAQANRSAASVTIALGAQGPAGPAQPTAQRQSTPSSTYLDLSSNLQAAAANHAAARPRSSIELPSVAATAAAMHDVETGQHDQRGAIDPPAHEAAAQVHRPQNHPVRDAWLPIAGQALSLAGATALLNYGVAHPFLVGNGNVGHGIAGFLTVWACVAGSCGVKVPLRGRSTMSPDTRTPNPPSAGSMQ
jgi:hypothetical protein